ncbi:MULTISPECIES: hypothetical protein [Xenorhabdus]|uniref:hypothetical protein n=1 Tax=Xenorhabdus TaxID=626 RepID=UPI0006466AE9|nr:MULTISPECIES: hypothetical protein [Xenorhabdus]MBC8946487.1 hypothetical protein [Xenorhabdus indica]
MKKILLIIIVLFTLGSIGGIILAGMNMYNRSTASTEEPQQTQQEQIQQEVVQQETTSTEQQ